MHVWICFEKFMWMCLGVTSKRCQSASSQMNFLSSCVQGLKLSASDASPLWSYEKYTSHSDVSHSDEWSHFSIGTNQILLHSITMISKIL